MPSLIPGYEYDIFISYRQKDNKGDRWVSEFVEALKTELESTFKEDISVYFDENPHDGLLETHDVDASLKEKLKCLIFIPIISRTYCDPKSFAWEHEFKAFVEMASKDPIGLKIKLADGNVTSRVLPVIIHNLDPGDLEICQNILGGRIRGIEFIYKEAGVNRPLRVFEEEPKNNRNHTIYRNQINKVSNTIKEILRSCQAPQSRIVDKYAQQRIPGEAAKPKIHKIIGASLAVILILISAILFLPKFFKSEPEKSIAVLPFTNDSHDDSTNYYVIGIEEAIRNNLQSIKSFRRVLPRTTTEHLRGKIIPSFAKIAKDLKVNYIVEGGILKFGNKFQLNVKLINTINESQMWAQPFEKEINSTTDIFQMEGEIAQAIANQLKALITPDEKMLINTPATKNMEALDAYLKGEFYRKNLSKAKMKIAEDYYKIALEKDPEFALAYCSLAKLYGQASSLGYLTSADANTKHLKAISAAARLDSTLSDVQFGLAIQNLFDWNWKAYESGVLKAIHINPNKPIYHADYSLFLLRNGRPRDAKIHMDMALALDPADPDVVLYHCLYLKHQRKYTEVIKISYETLRMDPDNGGIESAIAPALLLHGDADESMKFWEKTYKRMYEDFDHAFEKGYSKSGIKGALNSEADTLAAQSTVKDVHPGDIAYLYAAAQNKAMALKFWEKTFEEHDQNITLLNDPINDFLKSDPHYRKLCRKVGLPINY